MGEAAPSGAPVTPVSGPIDLTYPPDARTLAYLQHHFARDSASLADRKSTPAATSAPDDPRVYPATAGFAPVAGVLAALRWCQRELLVPSWTLASFLIPVVSGLSLVGRGAIVKAVRKLAWSVIFLFSLAYLGRAYLWPLLNSPLLEKIGLNSSFWFWFSFTLMSIKSMLKLVWRTADSIQGAKASTTDAATTRPFSFFPSFGDSFPRVGWTVPTVESISNIRETDQMATTAGSPTAVKKGTVQATAENIKEQLIQAIAATSIPIEDKRKLAAAFVKVSECGADPVALCVIQEELTGIISPSISPPVTATSKDICGTDGTPPNSTSAGNSKTRQKTAISAESQPLELLMLKMVEKFQEVVEKAAELAVNDDLHILPVDVQRFLRENPEVTGAEFRAMLGMEMEHRKREQRDRQKVTPELRRKLTNLPDFLRVMTELRIKTPFWESLKHIQIPTELTQHADLDLPMMKRWLSNLLDNHHANKLLARGIVLKRCEDCGQTVKEGHVCFACEVRAAPKGGMAMKKQTIVSTDGTRVTQKARMIPDIDLMQQRLQEAQAALDASRQRFSPANLTSIPPLVPVNPAADQRAQLNQLCADAATYAVLNYHGQPVAEKTVNFDSTPSSAHPTKPIVKEESDDDSDVEMVDFKPADKQSKPKPSTTAEAPGIAQILVQGTDGLIRPLSYSSATPPLQQPANTSSTTRQARSPGPRRRKNKLQQSETKPDKQSDAADH
jgi:hypothetical protein